MTAAPSEFDADTALEPLGDGRFAALLSSRWSIGPYPNGGYLLALAVRAMAAVSHLPDPLATSAHYLAPSEHDRPAEVRVTMVRAGRSVATLSASLVQDDRERMRVTTSFTDLTAATGPTLELGRPPDLPPLEACAPSSPARMPHGLDVAIRDRFDTRMDPARLGWLAGRPEGLGVMAGYLRFVDGREPDPIALMLIADAFPPPVFDLAPTGWVPTLEFSVHVRARPAPGWLRCRFSTLHLRDGFLEEDGEIWDSDGVLVCQSRQLARVNAPAR